ncbi:hypothetical protein BHE74_00031943 [Ensete ventricosum]|nr:hypothetical protein BHE74_00031943 [Ensete ventricosum]
MSILNQSISPNGQPQFPLKGSTAQDACQNVQMGLPLRKTSTLKAYRSSFMKTASSVHGASDVGSRTDGHNDILDGSTGSIRNLPHLLQLENPSENGEKCKISVCSVKFQPFNPSFMHAFVENEEFCEIEDVGKRSDQGSFRPSDVLVVSVSSAVELDDRQMDLITRKMQRLTGFRKLRLENTVDPTLIAGFVISYCSDGSHAIDLSVKGQLATLAARLESSDQKTANTVQSWSFPNNMS